MKVKVINSFYLNGEQISRGSVIELDAETFEKVKQMNCVEATNKDPKKPRNRMMKASVTK